MSAMRVAMVSEHASPLALLGGVDAGGQNVHVAGLAAALGDRGVPVAVHTRRDSPSLPRRVRMHPNVVVDHVTAGPPAQVGKDDLLPYMGAFAAELHEQWRRRRPDVVHAHFWMSGLAAVQAAKPLGIPVVLTLHALGVVKRRHQGLRDTSAAERVPVEGWLVRDIVDRIVATCPDEVFELLRMGAPRRRITVVPCGVDVDRFGAGWPAEWAGLAGPAESAGTVGAAKGAGLAGPTELAGTVGTAESRPAGRRRVLVVGRLVERKGIGDVITALSRVPRAELVVAGGPDAATLDADPEVRRLRALAEAVGVADRVDFRGRVGRDELPALYRSADIVACVPWYEPFGIVPLEAMACGVPVVASAVGGLAETVVDGTTGLHVPPRCPERLADALRHLLDDEAWRAELGAAGMRRARARYSWDRVASLTLGVYRTLLDGIENRGRFDHQLDAEVPGVPARRPAEAGVRL